MKKNNKKYMIFFFSLFLWGCDQKEEAPVVQQKPIQIPEQPKTNISPNNANKNNDNNTVSLDSLKNGNVKLSSIDKLSGNNSLETAKSNNQNQQQNFLITNDPIGMLNSIRSKMGIPTLNRNTDLDTAARFHAQYILANNEVSHDEDPNKPYFFAKTPLERVQKTNYHNGQAFTTGEVLSYTEGDPNESFDKLMRAIYHRFVMLDPIYNEVGLSQIKNQNISVLEMSLASRGSSFKNALLKVSIYPLDGQTGIPYVFYTNEEIPNPMPGYERVGFPISIQTTSGYPLETRYFGVMEKNTNSPVPGKYLKYGEDQHVSDSQLAFIPYEPLKPNTMYKVKYGGSSKGIPLNYEWNFTTAAIPNMNVSVNQQVFKPGMTVQINYTAQESKQVKSSTTISGTEKNLLQLEKEQWGNITYKVLEGCLDPQGCKATITFKNEDNEKKSVEFIIMPN